MDREGLKSMTEDEVHRMAVNVLHLHKRCGRPNNRALMKALAARGADGRTLWQLRRRSNVKNVWKVD